MIQKSRFCCTSIFVFYLIWNSVFAQNNTFQKFGLKEGLSSTRVFTTIEDSLGFLWIATDVGVDRFDGANFKHYSLSNFEEIRKVRFYRFYLKKDEKNQIWLLANNGMLYKYSTNQDEFVLFHRLKTGLGKPLLAYNLYIDHKGKFWIGCETGVYTFDVQSHTTELYSGLPGGSIHAIIQDDKNYFYLAGSDGVSVLNPNYKLVHNLFEVCPSPGLGINEGRIRSLFVDEKHNRLWIGSDTKGLCAFDLTNFEFVLPSGLKDHVGLSIRAIKQYASNSLIMSIDGVGLFILDLDKLVPTHKFSFKQDDPNSLSANSIFDIFQNKDSIFFISTYRGGLNVYNPNQLNIQSMSQIPGEINSLENNNILSICEVSGGVIGFGTAKGVSLWNKNKNSWKHLSEIANKNNMLSGFVHAIAVDHEQNLWTSSFTDNIARYNLTATGQYILSNQIPSGYNSGEIRSIYSSGRDLVYFANGVDGIMLYSLSKDTTQLFPIKGINVILPLSETELALGGPGGLWILDIQKAKLEKPNYINSSILNEQIVNSLFVDAEKQLWVGTSDAGVFVVNFESKTIEQISGKDGLPSNYIFSIVEANSFTWVSTPKGISRIDKERSVYSLFDSDGLISTDFNENAAIKASDGTLYFGTNNGVIYFNPDNIEPVNSSKSLVLTDFHVNHKLTLVGKDSPLKQAINSTQYIELAYSQNSFAIDFSTIDFIHPGYARIEWKLEGFDDNWISYDNTNRINYTNLSPGSYKLNLRIVNENAEILTDEKHIEFLVNPPLWRTKGAYVLYGISLVFLIFALYYFGKLRMESKKSEERLNFLINTAHEIKTPLTLIKAPLQDLLKNESFDSHAKENLNLALESTDKLQKQMIQFLDFRKIKVERKSLFKESVDLILFFQEKILAFQALCKRKGIELTFNSSVSEFTINTDPKIMDVVISNLISNAIKYTKEKGKVSIEMGVKAKLCEVYVRDTGIGIPKSQQKKIFNLFYRAPEALEEGISGSGVGLVLAFDLAKRIKGKVSLVESSNKGSTFKFSFPYELATPMIEPEKEWVDQVLTKGSIAEGNIAKLLLVENDDDLLKYGKRKLQEKYHILTAKNGKSALDKVNKCMPDIIVSDVSMPKMNGRQLCMNLKSNIDTCHIPVILLTGLASKENVIQGLESGADEYLTKPVEYDVLSKRIDSLLENRQLLRKKFLGLDEEEDEDLDLPNERDKTFIYEITQYIEDHISDPELSVYDLYEVTAMSRTPFYHKIKYLTGLSPSEFIKSIRLKKAKTLLKNKAYNISEVAYSVGFSDPKYFSTSFKKYFGQSPSKLRG